MTDIVAELRDAADNSFVGSHADLMQDAADEIERLIDRGRVQAGEINRLRAAMTKTAHHASAALEAARTALHAAQALPATPTAPSAPERAGGLPGGACGMVRGLDGVQRYRSEP
jgi:hypothetical protein